MSCVRHPLSVVIFLIFFLVSPVWAQTGVDQDQRATAQLREAYQQVDGLKGITLEARGGVAVLRGDVPSLEASLKAEELAQKVEGVLTVDNGLQIESKVTERLSPVLSKLRQKAQTFVTYLPLMGVAIITFMIFLAFGRSISRWDGIYRRLSGNVFIQDLLRQIAYFLSLAAGLLLALEILDATALVGAVLGTAGVLGVAIGFAFQDLAENSLASILLSLRQPFSPNDHVVIDGHEGKVVRLTSRATVLLTLDGNHLRIPNASVFKATILNYSKNPERRFRFTVGVDTEEDLTFARELALRTLKESTGVMSEPPPQCLVVELGDSTVNLDVVGWVDQREAEYLKVKSEAIRRVKESFDEAGILMPEPIYKVRMEQTEPAQRPVKKTPVVTAEEAVDVSPETHLEQRILEERVSEEQDLLSTAARLE